MLSNVGMICVAPDWRGWVVQPPLQACATIPMPKTMMSMQPPLLFYNISCEKVQLTVIMKELEGAISREKGQRYEELACTFLVKQGWKILHRNYHSRYGEIDIIASREKELAFIEVKGRKDKTTWNDDAVPVSKQRKIRRTAEIFLMKTEEEYSESQFGVLWIEGDDITLMENAF